MVNIFIFTKRSKCIMYSLRMLCIRYYSCLYLGNVNYFINGWGFLSQIGNSLYDPEGAKIVPKLMEKAQKNNVQLHFPVDFITADKFAEDATAGEASLEGGVPDGWMGLDIGPKSRLQFAEVIKRAKVIVWNGYVDLKAPKCFPNV